ncbi:MAG TPA: SigE family RNA polymerase sigma factor [Acidimicrobiales bacterium]|nr:SigE family RNA polymerase sigma factor [Acidimicrobiales bacterium]
MDQTGTAEHATGDLFSRAYAPMVRLAHLITGSNAIAEELVQDAFVAVLPRISQLTNPHAYLRMTVVNRCRSWGRRQRLEQRQASPADESFVDDVGHAELVDALAGLPTRQRAAVVLRYYEDLSEAEIADALGCRPGTVKSLLSRGLASLREVVER